MGKIEDLENLLKSLDDWEKAVTNIPGVKIIKIPARDTIPERLAVEINPVDEAGNIIKKKGAITITNEELFGKYAQIFENEKASKLMAKIEELRTRLSDFPIEDKKKQKFEI